MVNMYHSTPVLSMTGYNNINTLIIVLACLLVYMVILFIIFLNKRKLARLSLRTQNWFKRKNQSFKRGIAKKLQTAAINKQNKKKEKKNEKELEDYI